MYKYLRTQKKKTKKKYKEHKCMNRKCFSIRIRWKSFRNWTPPISHDININKQERKNSLGWADLNTSATPILLRWTADTAGASSRPPFVFKDSDSASLYSVKLKSLQSVPLIKCCHTALERGTTHSLLCFVCTPAWGSSQFASFLSNSILKEKL